MTREEVLGTFDFIEKEDLQVWPDSIIGRLALENIMSIIDYLSEAPITGEELLVYDLPVFLYPVDRFKVLWLALSKKRGKALAEMIREEELTPSDEFERMEKKNTGHR